MCRTLKSEVFFGLKSRVGTCKHCFTKGLRGLNSALSCFDRTATFIIKFTGFAIKSDSCYRNLRLGWRVDWLKNGKLDF